MFSSLYVFLSLFWSFWFLQDYGKCPVTGEPLTLDDIIPVKTGKVILSEIYTVIFSNFPQY